MMRDHLDEQFEAYLACDDDALIGNQFFETLAEIERRRAQGTIEVTLRLVNGRPSLSRPTTSARRVTHSG
jgi:hypothetical protein